MTGGGGRPPGVEALRAIGESDLPPAQRDLLRVLLTWWNPRTSEAWPTLTTIAEHAGRDRVTIRRALAALEEAGIVEVIERSKGGVNATGRGKGHKIRLHLDRLNRCAAHQLPPGANRCAESGEPVRPERRTGAQSAPNRCAAHHKPSIQPSSEMQIEPCADSAARLNGCMDHRQDLEPTGPPTVRDALTELGIRGANLDKLAASDLTVEQIEAEAKAIRADPNVRNLPAVLAKRLADMARVKLAKSPRLSQQDRSAVARLENLRRSQGRARDDPTGLGDMLGVAIQQRMR